MNKKDAKNRVIDKRKTYDFRSSQLRWGWNILNFKISDYTSGSERAEIDGIGSGLDVGCFVLVSHTNQDAAWKIDSIKYKNNPKDMFCAKLSCIGALA